MNLFLIAEPTHQNWEESLAVFPEMWSIQNFQKVFETWFGSMDVKSKVLENECRCSGVFCLCLKLGTMLFCVLKEWQKPAVTQAIIYCGTFSNYRSRNQYLGVWEASIAFFADFILHDLSALSVVNVWIYIQGVPIFTSNSLAYAAVHPVTYKCSISVWYLSLEWYRTFSII